MMPRKRSFTVILAPHAAACLITPPHAAARLCRRCAWRLETPT